MNEKTLCFVLFCAGLVAGALGAGVAANRYYGAKLAQSRDAFAGLQSGLAAFSTGLSDAQSQADVLSGLNQSQRDGVRELKSLSLELEGTADEIGRANTALGSLLAEIARRVGDAANRIEPSGERLQEANEDLAASYDYMDSIERENKRLKRGAAIGFCFGAAGCFGGTPLLAEGLRTGDAKLALSGAAVIAGTSGIWAAGHFLFHWW